MYICACVEARKSFRRLPVWESLQNEFESSEEHQGFFCAGPSLQSRAHESDPNCFPIQLFKAAQNNQAQRCMPVILVLGRQRQENL